MDIHADVTCNPLVPTNSRKCTKLSIDTNTMMFTARFFLAAVFCVKFAASTESPTVQAGMVVGQLRVAPSGGRSAMISIGSNADQFEMGVDSSGGFIITSPRGPILTADKEDNLRIHATLSARCVVK